ncbi:30S ribosomal protein S4 [Hippea maritima]|uniref:Small ribosomal subunit protein uS4 n=1 Tax=Hippea maritima (strain ATCC 700847 / DSM 10411 / MH2) TaxID=760142 RepID=F2LXR5_HIPMA|nr:30S ribosomal protein S4 [Hippea maritima]AEA34306.1 ribosomal protein S4 [Hippea maritima DSM 10411]
MAVYTGPACRRCRALGVKLFLKGDRCFTDKCAFERRPYPPGKSRNARRKMSSYGLHLAEKQKAKAEYGVLERQFRKYFEEAKRQKGETGANLVVLLERRLDNVVYRSGMASSRREARRLVTHGHIRVNGHKVDIPSYLVRKGDVITVSDKMKAKEEFKRRFEENSRRMSASWINVDLDNVSATFVDMPTRDDVQPPFNENAIVELYSK